jgi:hypothetical protein
MYRAERNAIIEFYVERHTGDFGKTRAAYIEYVSIIKNLHDLKLPFSLNAAENILEEYKSAQLEHLKQKEAGS